MSGIYGVVRYDNAPVTREILAPIAKSMSDWGPDGHGQWAGESAGLGNFALCVTPESRGERMPASIRSAPHLVITADARIDNRDELFDALSVPAQGRSKTPDSSLILLAYEQWGAEGVRRLLGDFAFAIWDTRERTLFCARDPFGCRPLVYFHDGARTIFASDIRGIVACLESPRLNEPLLAAHLQSKTYYAQKRQTFFEGVVKLPPGHTLRVNNGRALFSRYWTPEDISVLPYADDTQYTEELARLFRQSVECRVRSIFPVGAHMSGGLDSSAVAIAASRALSGRELPVFSWSPPPGSGDEYSRIDAVCRQERLRCDYLPATAANLIELFQRDFAVEPMAMMAREGNIQKQAQDRGIRVILSGWGGDEGVTSRMDPLRLGIRDRIAVRLPDSLYSRLIADPFMKHASPCIREEFVQRYRNETEQLRGPSMRRQPDIRSSIVRLLDIGHLSLRMEDWAVSGAHRGLVYSYPMLDKRLVEFALGMASPTQRRSLFRRAMTHLLPPTADWERVKTETATFSALEKEHIEGHARWAEHIEKLPPNRFVDPQLIQNAVQTATRTRKIHSLRGVREAFGCYALKTCR